MVHAADFNRDAPGECKQNWLEKVFGSNPKVVNFSKDVFDGYQYSEFQRTELRAHAAELRCLSRKLRDKSYCKGGCDAALIQRINDIVDVMIPAVMAGTYGVN